MSVGTCWVEATDEAAPELLSEAIEGPNLWLTGIGELELSALGAILDIDYDPSCVLETDGGVVLRIPESFLVALAGLPGADVEAVATAWQERADHVRRLDFDEVVRTLRAMVGFARDAAAGPGVLSMPMV